MIDLKRKRNPDPIADDWLGWVRDYFFTDKVGKERPWLDINGNRIYFNNYAQKLKFQLDSKAQEYSRGNKNVYHWCSVILRWFWVHFDSVIIALPAKLEVWVTRIQSTKCPKHLMEKLKEVVVPYYDVLSKKYGHDLVDALNIKTCPYCNRQFIHSFQALRAERPELDHFYPKGLYPMFCLSFYNLIPVCHACNHVKLENQIGVNPYSRAFKCKFLITDETGKNLSISKIYKLTEKEIRLKFDGCDSAEEENVKVLGLENVYNKHVDYVKELIDKSLAYDKYARQALVTAFQGAGNNPRLVYDFVWGRHLMTAEYEDRPLSKLTKDILDMLEIK